MIKKSRIKKKVIDAGKAVEFYNQAVSFHQNNHLPESESAYRMALKLNPEFAEAHNNLGNVLKDQGRQKEALSEYRKALKIYPDNPILLNNIGNTLFDIGETIQAIKYLTKTIELDSDYAEAYNNLGNAYCFLGKHDEAIEAYSKALALNPNIPAIHKNLAELLVEVGRREDAITFYKQALTLEPQDYVAASALSNQMQYLCEWNGIEQLYEKLDKLVLIKAKDRNVYLGSPFPAISRTDDLEQNFLVAKAASRNTVDLLPKLNKPFTFSKKKRLNERLTIGYLSNDFHDHATMHLMLGVLREHDKGKVRVKCYSYGEDDHSDYRKKVVQFSDEFVDISKLDNLAAAKRINSDGVDILIDLKGYTKDNRLAICAYKPAPIQATYLGFPGTSGADFFDYIITDKVVTPESHESYYSEKFAYMPDTYQPNDDQQIISDKLVSRPDFNLPEDGFVFCSFNQSYKIEPVFFDIWMRLLQQVEHSVLWLLVDNETAVNNLKHEAEKRDVDSERLVFAEKLPKELHLARIGLADLVLDTRIYNGHTTTADALWAGVPVVTMQGHHFASRVSSSLLQAIGLSELVTKDLDSYESLVLRIASSPNELEEIREKLHQNRNTAPLFDTVRFTRNLEAAYGMMWQRYVDGKKPDHFEVMIPD